MIRKLFSFAILLAVGLLGYNYFFGDVHEKAQSKEVFNKIGDLGKDLGQVLKSEHQKMKNGKYDKVLDKLGNTYKSLRKTISKADADLLEKLDQLEMRKEKAESEYKDLTTHANEQSASEVEEIKTDLEAEIKEIIKETEALIQSVDSN